VVTASIHALARTAADAVTALCACLDDCAREVEARTGTRKARATMRRVRLAAWEALYDLRVTPEFRLDPRGDEIAEIRLACWAGYVRPSWALRIVQLAQEVEPLPASKEDAT
jgi:hypothetical protein